MMSFRGTRLQNTKLPLSIVWLLETLAESKGRQQLYKKQSPQLLKSLIEMALIESAESSNRIEGITVERNRLRPLAPDGVPGAMEELCLAYRHSIDQLHVTPLLASACFVLDFLCIHPFRDGNGRISRLLTLLFCYHHGHEVGRYIIFERIVEQTKEDYYEALKASSSGWHEGVHDIIPWFSFLLSVWRKACREFEDRAERQRPQRGSKTEIVEYALGNMTGPFGIADVERLCPNVSRDTIRLVMNRWRELGRLNMLGKGRDAKWQRKG
ncbi:MAG: Fic family protein [Pseudomonadota bacterium]